MVEFDFHLILVFDEVELYILDLLSFHDLPKLFQKIHLRSLSLHLPHHHSDRRNLFLKIFLLKFEEGLKGLLMCGIAHTHENE